MKPILAVVAITASSIASAQIPDIKIHLDATVSYLAEQDGGTLVRFYDPLGRPSTIALWFYTEQGFRAYVAERLQRLPGDANTDLFDEYYVEDEGIWRVGKQYLPFGAGRILHESALAARGDTNLILEGLPMSIALCNGGVGFDSGLIGRFGSSAGVSFAFGRHFGISGTSLDVIRRPEDAPGEGRGWRQVFGFDVTKKLGRFTLKGEAADFGNGETALDKAMTVLDLGATFDPKKGQSYTLAWSRLEPNHDNFYRLGGAFTLTKNVSFEPMIRFKDSSLFDLSAQIRIRI